VFKFAFDWGLIATPVRYGGGFSNPITKEFTKLLEKLKIKRLGLSFYALRHTFYTAGEYFPGDNW
jgi:integrase